MTAQNKRRVLMAACGLLVTILAFRVFYFQELFFALLLFAGGYLILLLLVLLALGLWSLYARGVVYLAARAAQQGHRTLPLLRILVLWSAPALAKTAETVIAGQQVLFYPFRDLMHGWLHSLRLDASHFRGETERAVKHLRLLLKQS